MTMLFAHNGVDHSSTAGTIGHSLPQIVLIALLVSLGVAAFMAAATYTVRHLGLIEIPIKERED